MKLFHLVLLSLSLAVLTMSCGDTSKKDSSDEKSAITRQKEKDALNNTKPITTTVNPNQSQPGATPAGMNPPHGQPGHDCKIPVGKPLDGSGGTVQSQSQSQPQFQTTPTINPQQQPSKPVQVTPAGMNPPHGQPGHDCKIPVGKPLDGSGGTK